LQEPIALQPLAEEARLGELGRKTSTRFITRLVRDKPLGAFGGFLLLLFLLIAVFADVIAPQPYDKISFAEIMDPPSPAHLLGTDYLGRDLLSRMIYGARVSIFVALSAVVGATLISVTLGIVSAWYGGTVDALIQRFLVNTWIALPSLLVLLTLASMSLVVPARRRFAIGRRTVPAPSLPTDPEASA